MFERACVLSQRYIDRLKEKWFDEYISNIKLDNIIWIKFNAYDLNEFLVRNYFDKEEYEYVTELNNNTLYPSILGLQYLNTSIPNILENYNYLIGVVENNIHKKTIVAALVYSNNYHLDQEQVTHIFSIDTNKYVKNVSLYQEMFNVFLKNIPRQKIIIPRTYDNELGIDACSIVKDEASKNDFNNAIVEYGHNLIESNIYKEEKTHIKRYN